MTNTNPVSDFWGTVNAQLDRIEREKPDTFEKVAAILEPIYDQGEIYGAGSHDSEPYLYLDGTRNSVGGARGSAWPTYKPRRAFFAGGGGDRSLASSLSWAGWMVEWSEAHYFYVMRHQATGALLTYIEGDVLPGDAR